MDVSAEAADLVVREGIQATEAAAKLSGEALKNVAALLIAIAKQDMKVVGETSSKRLARDTSAPAVVIHVKAEDKAKFQKLAKEFGVLYFIAQKKGNSTGVLNVVSNQNYAAQLNAVMEQMGYPIPRKEKQEDASAKKANPRAPQEKSSNERGSGWSPSPTSTTEQTDIEPDSPTKKRLERMKRLAAQSHGEPGIIKGKVR
ncbi:MAG: PcfB family protein [Oscillospiraceae bacterium]|nr:PcfB family protein [Oscillospiraceae bacterium]